MSQSILAGKRKSHQRTSHITYNLAAGFSIHTKA
jgi:hypothetical protein